WFFGIHGALALTALDNGIMTLWALENIATYQQYGSVEAALAAGKTFHIWPADAGLLYFPWGQWCDFRPDPGYLYRLSPC
ncbi:PTS system, lactose/cellobiose family IIC component, partial [Shigella boydii 4444-74]